MNTNYEKEFVPYEQALALKELGFDEPCIAFATITYKDVIHCGIGFKVHKETDLPTKPFSVPTWRSAFRWFREKYGLKISFPYWNGFNKMIPEDLGRDKYEIMIIPANHRTISVRNPKGRIWFDTYEEAELECLKQLIEIVKQQL